MPHFDFDEALREYRKDDEPVDPITFTYGGELFTVMSGPMLGDVMELHDAPEIRSDTDEAAALALLKFVRRLLPVEDRQRFEQAHYRIPATQSAPAMIKLGIFVTEQVTGSFPTKPPVSSATGPPSHGRTSSKRTGGTGRSSKPRPGSGSPSSTGGRRSA
jgi:hypothetical protein